MAEDPKKFQQIIDTAVFGPAQIGNEQAWVIYSEVFQILLNAIPSAKRDLQGIPIGGPTGWLTKQARPVIDKDLHSQVNLKDPKDPDTNTNLTGLLTFKGNFLLWRHAVHYNHNVKGGGAKTGVYDAYEAYKLPGDIAVKCADQIEKAVDGF
jgi:hypothetical protein